MTCFEAQAATCESGPPAARKHVDAAAAGRFAPAEADLGPIIDASAKRARRERL
jgi:hypothetical protein